MGKRHSPHMSAYGRFRAHRGAGAGQVSPARRRCCIMAVCERLAVPERRTCLVQGQPRWIQRREPQGRDDEEALTAAANSPVSPAMIWRRDSTSSGREETASFYRGWGGGAVSLQALNRTCDVPEAARST